jgi:hypothetical protein
MLPSKMKDVGVGPCFATRYWGQVLFCHIDGAAPTAPGCALSYPRSYTGKTPRTVGGAWTIQQTAMLAMLRNKTCPRAQAMLQNKT